jgi:hypothetical protein
MAIQVHENLDAVPADALGELAIGQGVDREEVFRARRDARGDVVSTCWL